MTPRLKNTCTKICGLIPALPLFSVGLEHAGCYYVPVYSTVLFSMEGLTSDLTDDPLYREDPIRKCGTAAQLYSFDIFAVSVGYCVSGSSDVEDYRQYPSTLCQQGIGEQSVFNLSSSSFVSSQNAMYGSQHDFT